MLLTWVITADEHKEEAGTAYEMYIYQPNAALCYSLHYKVDLLIPCIHSKQSRVLKLHESLKLAYAAPTVDRASLVVMISAIHPRIALGLPRDKCASNEGRRSDAAFVRGVECSWESTWSVLVQIIL